MNMKQLFVFKTIIFILLILSQPAWSAVPESNITPSQIHSVENLNFLKNIKQKPNEKLLVIFDVDKVLIMKADPWDRGFDEDRKKSKTINSLFVPGSALYKELDRPTRDKLWSIYINSVPSALVDQANPKIIQNLQNRSIKVIALTRFFTGKIGTIPSISDWRFNELKNFGIDFSNAFPNNNNIVFNQFSYEDKHPEFKSGILFTTLAVSKGDLLKAFLDQINWKPTKVIMIDDLIDNLKSVEDSLNKMGIAFEGYEYRAYLKYPSHYDKKVAEYQMKYLIDHEKWINRDQAKKLIGLP